MPSGRERPAAAALPGAASNRTERRDHRDAIFESRRCILPSMLCIKSRGSPRVMIGHQGVARDVAAPTSLQDATGRPIRVLTVDDHPLFREGIAAVLNLEPDIRVTGEAQ